MTYRVAIAGLVLALAASAQQPLPVLRIEPTGGGSIFYIRNAGSQPVTAFVIELVNYPGSYYALWRDDHAGGLIAPGTEKRIPITNMTVGAVPDYVKLEAALFADGSSAGIAEKVTQLVERRRSVLQTTRELIARIEKGTPPAELKQWSESLAPARRADPKAQATINSNAARGVIGDAIAWMEAHSKEEALTNLRAVERALGASKPPL